MADMLYPRFNRAASALRADRLARELDELMRLEESCEDDIGRIVQRLRKVVNWADGERARDGMAEVLKDALWTERKRVQGELEKAEREAGEEL